MLSDRCLSVRPVLSCLPVPLVYCGQTVGWMTMTLGVEVGVDTGHIALDGDLATQKGGHSTLSTFRSMSIVAKRSTISASADLLFNVAAIRILDFNKSSAVAEMIDHLATIDMGRKVGGCCAPFGRELGPQLTQCDLGRGLYLRIKWHLIPSSRLATTDTGRKWRGLCPKGYVPI